MSKKSISWITVGVALGGLVLGVLISLRAGQDASPGPHSSGTTVSDRETSPGERAADLSRKEISSQSPARDQIMSEADVVDWAVASLRANFSDRIELKSTQAELLKLRQFLADNYPNTWEALFKTIIAQAFPDHADTILATLSRLDIYNAWLAAAKTDLADRDHDQIMEALWAQRRKLFGADADEMWAEETRTEAIIDVLDIMRDSFDTNLDEKLNLYVQAIGRAYEDSVDAFMGNRKYYLSRAFLRMDSVQENLKAMDEQQRSQSIRDVRLALGYTEAEIESMARNDEKNEQRWQQGYQYMNERARILASYEGETQKEKLAALQETYFSKQAKTIQAEEASGFYRFNRPRVYGAN